MLKGNQKKIDVAKPFGRINEKDFAKLRTNKKDFSYITEINKEGEGIKFTNSVKDFMTDAQKLFESNEFEIAKKNIQRVADLYGVPGCFCPRFK